MMNYDYKKDGITQGLLCGWQECREQTRLYLDGWTSKISSMALIYGTIGHAVLEKAYKDIQMKKLKYVPSPETVKAYVGQVERQWHLDNPKADKKALEYVELSCLIAESTLPLYFEYWKKDMRTVKWYKLEHEFAIPYTTTDKRTTILKGKMDGVFFSPGIWLLENKFKSMINLEDIVDALPLDFQVRFYLWAVNKILGKSPAGCVYNIIRRTSLKQKVGETLQQFATRISEDIKVRQDFYFMRLEVAITKKEIDAFEKELDGLIRSFMDWCEGKNPHYARPGQCLNQYGRCKYLGICSGKYKDMYFKREKIFSELEV